MECSKCFVTGGFRGLYYQRNDSGREGKHGKGIRLTNMWSGSYQASLKLHSALQLDTATPILAVIGRLGVLLMTGMLQYFGFASLGCTKFWLYAVLADDDKTHVREHSLLHTTSLHKALISHQILSFDPGSNQAWS